MYVGMRPKGSAEKLEARRRLAASMLSKGRGIRDVARTIGAAPSSVKRWKDALEEGGKNALKIQTPYGTPLASIRRNNGKIFSTFSNKGLGRRTYEPINGPVDVWER